MAKPYQHLTVDDRIIIEHEQRKGSSCTDIARMLHRHRTTVSREVRRNALPNGRYDSQLAQQRAQIRRSEASSQPRPQTAQRWQEFAACLRQHPRKMSPELYHGRCTQVAEKPSLSPSWLYELLRRDRAQGHQLYQCLPRQGRKYRRRAPGHASASKIPFRVDIEQRPPAVDTRQQPGHWEADTIIGHGHQGVIVSVVERYSRFTCLRVLPHRQAPMIAWALIDMLISYRPWVQTITVDNGLEFAAHTIAAQHLQAQFYFCKPYHAWQRGTIEQLNGLVRRTFPKKYSLHQVSYQALEREAQQLNQMPRKVLGFRTPLEVFKDLQQRAPPMPIAPITTS